MTLFNSRNSDIAEKQAALNRALMKGTRAEMKQAQDELTAAVLEGKVRIGTAAAVVLANQTINRTYPRARWPKWAA